TVGALTLGTGTVAFTAAETYSGTTTVTSGTLTLSSSGSLNAAGTTGAITVTGATLKFDNTAATATRIAGSPNITFNGGNFTLTSGGTANGESVTFGTVNLASGVNTITS